LIHSVRVPLYRPRRQELPLRRPETGGKAAAIAYTRIETAKLNAVDPHAWLADTLARIPDYKINKADELLPWRWNR
jgi:hypothetical protein